MRIPSVPQLQRRAKDYNSDKPKGDRSKIFGTRTFERYPENSKLGTSEHPFIFWPIAWPNTVGGGSPNAAYLHLNEDKYGNATNPSRPGGSMMVSTFFSDSTSYTIVSDDYTVKILANAIAKDCASILSASFISNPTASIEAYSNSPQPEQVLQYYRSSSIALASDTYQNNATYSAKGTADTELPNLPGLNCFNVTIGNSAPLNMESASNNWVATVVTVVGLVGLAALGIGGYLLYEKYKARKPRGV